MPINWVDVPDPHNPPAGAPKLEAANLNKLAVIGDIGTAGTPTGDALKVSLGSADPVLSNFFYDATTGNLLSYQEDGITITLTYNSDGTVATSQRGTSPAKVYSYSGGNLVGVA